MCPLPDGSEDSSPSTAAFEHQDAATAPNHHDPDTCCQLLGDASAIAQALAAFSAVKAALPSFPAVLLVATLLAGAAGPVIKLIPVSNGPPRKLYQRFLTFWSHAPPL